MGASCTPRRPPGPLPAPPRGGRPLQRPRSRAARRSWARSCSRRCQTQGAERRPGTRPPGRAHALLGRRRLAGWRRPWPPLLLRGDNPCAPPEGGEGRAHRRGSDGVFGWAGPAVWRRQAAPSMPEARGLSPQRTAPAQAQGACPPASSRGEEACSSAAASWAQPWQVIGTAAVLAAGAPPRLVVPSSRRRRRGVSAARSGAQGPGAHASKAVTGALHRDRTAAPPCLAHARRRLLACAAAVLPQARRSPTLAPTPLAPAPPSTRLLPRVKVATQVTQSKDRLLRHLPLSWPVQALWAVAPRCCPPSPSPRGPRPVAPSSPAKSGAPRFQGPSYATPRRQHTGKRVWEGERPYGGVVRACSGAKTR